MQSFILDTVLAQSFVFDGTSNGEVYLLTSVSFKANQIVIIEATGQPTIIGRIKQVPGDDLVLVGPDDTSELTRLDLSSYTVALGATIRADSQYRDITMLSTYNVAIYEEEPTVAVRSVLVDWFGRKYTSTEVGSKLTLDVNIVSGTITFPPSINVDITGYGATPDSVQIVDGTNKLVMQADGSIYVHEANEDEHLGITVDTSTQSAVVLNDSTFTTILDYSIGSGDIFYLKKVIITGLAMAAEVEVVFISGGTTIVRHYIVSSADPMVLDEFIRARPFTGGAGVILRIRGKLPANIHTADSGDAWAAINGYLV